MAKFRSTPQNVDKLQSKKNLRRHISLGQVMQFVQLCALLYIAFKLS